MMKVISSQSYLDDEIVSEKMDALAENGVKRIVVPVINAKMKDYDGNDLYIMTDKHHTLKAAKELGIEIEFEETEGYEGMSGEDILKAEYIDSDWYYVEDGGFVF